MSVHGEEIINRLHPLSELHNPDNLMRKIIDNSIGEWLDRHDETVLFEGLFLNSATGGYLDLHGNDLGVMRNLGESDDNYRERLIYESLGHLTVDYLLNVYDLNIYAYVDDFNPEGNHLTSDNPYITHKGIMISTTEEIKKILEKKYVLGSEVVWIIL